MGAFQDQIAAAVTAIAGVAGVAVTYRRGAAWVNLTAMPGQSTFTVEDNYGATAKARSRDYLILASALVLSDVQVVPQRGDLIEEVVGNSVHVHEVLRPDGGEQVYRFSDHGRTTIRVHTKLKVIQPR